MISEMSKMLCYVTTIVDDPRSVDYYQRGERCRQALAACCGWFRCVDPLVTEPQRRHPHRQHRCPDYQKPKDTLALF